VPQSLRIDYVPPTTRLFALLDESKVTEEAREFFETTVEFKAILIRTWGTRRPPWTLNGITPHGGSVGHVPFDTFAEAKRAAEQHFGPAMGEWQEPPRDREPAEYIASTFFPGYIDWRVGLGPVERHRLFRADLRFVEYEGQNEHEHCAFCWNKFYLPPDDPSHRGDREYLLYGFATEDESDWVCEPCYYALRDILDFTAKVP
jgi:hypothetical protein